MKIFNQEQRRYPWFREILVKFAQEIFSSVQLLSRVRLFVTPWTAACQASLSITNSRSLLKLIFIESVMPSNHLILCCPLLLLPSIFPSIRVFSNESVLCIRWSKYWSFSFNISPSIEYSGLISFRIDWLDLLAVQGTLNYWALISAQAPQGARQACLGTPTHPELTASHSRPTHWAALPPGLLSLLLCLSCHHTSLLSQPSQPLETRSTG